MCKLNLVNSRNLVILTNFKARTEETQYVYDQKEPYFYSGSSFSGFAEGLVFIRKLWFAVFKYNLTNQIMACTIKKQEKSNASRAERIDIILHYI